MQTVKINLTVNKKKYTVNVPPLKSLLKVLRDNLGLMGTKIGCGKGECGACTVLIDGQPVTSCLIPVIQAENKEIITIEGIGSEDKLHPIQEAFVEEGAVQCGFCTPGMIVSSYALLNKNSNPTNDEIKEAISGNLCRCTGYTKIIQAVKKASKKMR